MNRSHDHKRKMTGAVLTAPCRSIAVTIVWLVLMAIGACFDLQAMQFVHACHWDTDASFKGSLVADLMRIPGSFLTFTLVAAALAVLLRSRPRAWAEAGLLALCGALSGLNVLPKWIFGRPRPVHDGVLTGVFAFRPFHRGIAGLLVEHNVALPSGDAALAFATAACLGWYFPRWRMAFWGLAAIAATERVLENAHHVSDVIAGAAFGILMAHLAWWLWARPLKDPQGVIAGFTRERVAEPMEDDAA